MDSLWDIDGIFVWDGISMSHVWDVDDEHGAETMIDEPPIWQLWEWFILPPP